MKKKKEKALERESEPPSNLDYWTDYYPLPFTDAATSSSKKLLEIKPAASTEFRKHICFQGATKRSRRKKKKARQIKEGADIMYAQSRKKVGDYFWDWNGKIRGNVGPVETHPTNEVILPLFNLRSCLARTRNFSNIRPTSRFKWKNSYRKSQLASSSYPLLSLSKVLLQFETEGQNHLSVRQTKLDQ